MLIKLKYWIFMSCLVAVCMLTALPDHLYGAECSGSTYKKPAFNQEITHFSPYDTIYLIVDCSDLKPAIYTVHANWVHKQHGIIRSDKYQFKTSEPLAKLISSVTSQFKELIRKQSDNPKHQVHHNRSGPHS